MAFHKRVRGPQSPETSSGRSSRISIIALLKAGIAAFFKYGTFSIAASLSYYAIFSLTPILLIMLAMVGRLFGDTQARASIVKRITTAMGERTGSLIDEMLTNASEPKSGLMGMVVGFVILFIGATGLFSQLKDSLNQVWNVRPKPGRTVTKLARTRLVGFGLVVLMGIAMISLLGVSTFVASSAEAIEDMIAVPSWVIQGIDLLVSMGIIAAILAVLYKYLPDAKIAWKDAWVGAGMTSALLAAGEIGLGIYLAKSSVASVYGAAGSLVVALVWIYYSSALLLFGAELTQCYSEMYGHRIEPADWAEPINKPVVQAKPEKVWRLHYDHELKSWDELAEEYRGKGRSEGPSQNLDLPKEIRGDQGGEVGERQPPSSDHRS